jgi:hypothetical protein
VLSTDTAESVGSAAAFIVDAVTARVVAIRLRMMPYRGHVLHWPVTSASHDGSVTVPADGVELRPCRCKMVGGGVGRVGACRAIMRAHIRFTHTEKMRRELDRVTRRPMSRQSRHLQIVASGREE